MNGGGRRVRVALADNYAVVVGVLVVLAAVGGYLTYTTHVDPATTTERQQVASWESSGQFTHQATVVDGTTAFDEGTVLRERGTYFRSLTPRLNGTFAYSYAASDGGALTAETTVSLVFRSVGRASDGNATVYWAVERPLTQRRTESLSPGERHTVPFAVNVSAVESTAERIDAEVGGTPGTLETVVVARTTLSGTRNGQPVETTRRYRLPIQPDGSVYRVDDPGVVADSGGQTERVTVPVEQSRLQQVGGPLLLLVGGGGVAGLVLGRRNGQLAVTDHEREWLAYRQHRSEFDGWITRARVPVESETPPTVEVGTLDGLVDVAIDTDNRVVEDDTRGVFLVMTDQRWYRYDPPTEPLDRAAGDPLAAGDGANHARFEGGDGADPLED